MERRGEKSTENPKDSKKEKIENIKEKGGGFAIGVAQKFMWNIAMTQLMAGIGFSHLIDVTWGWRWRRWITGSRLRAREEVGVGKGRTRRRPCREILKLFFLSKLDSPRRADPTPQLAERYVRYMTCVLQAGLS